MGVVKNDPKSWAVDFVIARADGAGELPELKRRDWMRKLQVRIVGVHPGRRVREEVHQDAAGVIDKLAKAFAAENRIYFARHGLLDLLDMVLRQGFLQRELNGSRRLILIRDDADGHGGTVVHRRSYFG